MHKEIHFKHLCYFGKSVLNYRPLFTSIYRLKRQFRTGSLEVILMPAFFYPSMLHAKQSAEDSQKLERYDILIENVLKCLTSCDEMLESAPNRFYFKTASSCWLAQTDCVYHFPALCQ